MAPEQFAGKAATVRSDLYALGLVLYELSTGRRAFDAVTIAGYRKKHSEETPTRPSAVLPDFDPAVERVILRCIEKDPAQRPSSATQVAAALPGGDPLAAALAAGETPSPEMVAAAGEKGAISPATAQRLLLGLAAAVVLSIVLTPRANLAAFVGGVEKSPEILRERAREILANVGVTRKPADSSRAFVTNFNFLRWARTHGGYGSGVDRDALEFSYRQAQNPLVPMSGLNGPYPGPIVTELDPAPVESGMAQVSLDTRGRLVRLQIVPPEHETETSPAPETDWSLAFREAGLDMNRFTPAEPRWTPRTFAAVRAAWEGPHPERPGLTMRVEAASYRGRLVSFRWLGPWSGSDREPFRLDPGLTVYSWILFVLLIGGTWLAWNNLRAGRGDRRGALRLGFAVYIVVFAMWALGSHHLAGTNEVWNLITGFCNAAAMGVGVWVIYLALEPFARRRWPQMLISWTRALSGGLRDPLVGRDVLIGATLGVAMGLILGPGRVLLAPLLNLQGPPPHQFDLEAPVNPGLSVAWILSTALDTLIRVLAIVFFLVLVRRVVRKEWIAAVVVGVIFVGQYLGMPAPAVTLPLAALSTGILVFATVRYGLLAAFVAESCRRIYGYKIYTNDPSNWMFYAGAVALILLAALVWWATKTALAGRPLFGGLALEEKAAAGD
jgi:serine/threonine-protein kinase